MQDNINQAIEKAIQFAPVVLFGTLVSILFLTGYLQSHFYTTTFNDILPTQYIATLFPLTIQILRLVTGFLSAAFMKKKRYVAGIIVLIFSIWLSVFEHNEAAHMGELWVQTELDLSTVTQMSTKVILTREIITNMMRILIWSALFLELFMAMWMGKKEGKKQSGRRINQRQYRQENGFV